MENIYNFFKAPTEQQREEIDWLCKKGLSNNYSICYIGAPIQGITAIAFAVMDAAVAPIEGLAIASVCLLKSSFEEAGQELAAGLEVGFRSIFQIALLFTSIVVGILFPKWVYGALHKLNIDKREKKHEITITINPSLDEQLPNAEDLSRLQKKIESLRLRNAQKKEAIKELEKRLEVGNENKLEDLVNQLREENLQMSQKIQQLQMGGENKSSLQDDNTSTWGQLFVKGCIGLISAGTSWQARAIIMAWAPKIILDNAIENEGWVIGGMLTGPAIIKASAPIIELAAAAAGIFVGTITASILYSAASSLQNCCITQMDSPDEQKNRIVLEL